MLQPFDEKNYSEILKEVGTFRYEVFGKDEPVPGGIFPKTLPFLNYNCVVAGTGDMLFNYTFIDNNSQITIPKGEQLIVTRLLRFDYNYGNPHYNADDYVIFPTIKGNIFRMKRSKAPDHFLKIANLAQIAPIAEAYHLPEEKSGPVWSYSNNGASLHVQIKESTQSSAPFVNLPDSIFKCNTVFVSL